jgi:hypothetical protein
MFQGRARDGRIAIQGSFPGISCLFGKKVWERNATFRSLCLKFSDRRIKASFEVLIKQYFMISLNVKSLAIVAKSYGCVRKLYFMTLLQTIFLRATLARGI